MSNRSKLHPTRSKLCRQTIAKESLLKRRAGLLNQGFRALSEEAQAQANYDCAFVSNKEAIDKIRAKKVTNHMIMIDVCLVGLDHINIVA